jgi:glycosyltransferase involved in cell wall biosynthesis
MSRLTIGVDARALTADGAGRGRILKEVLPLMIEELDGDSLVLYGAGDDPVPDLPPGRWRFVRLSRLWHLGVAWHASAACDVLFSANTYIAPLFASTPSASLVCDLVAFEQFRHAHRRARLNERLTLPLATRRCDRLFCISQSTADDLITRFPGARGKVRITPLAASQTFLHEPAKRLTAAAQRRLDLPPSFVLAVGTIEPRKNLVRLIEAHDRLPTELRERFPLLIVGDRGWGHRPFDAAASRAKGPLRLLGRVTDDDLNVLYRRCTVFCYPSLYEGFGLPVLEALGAGAAVITSTAASLPEVAGDAAVLVEPTDTAVIATALSSLLTDDGLRASYQSKAALQARRFSWSETARVLLHELRCLALQRRSGERAGNAVRS